VICRLLASQTSDYAAQIIVMFATSTSAESKLLLAAMEIVRTEGRVAMDL
jgi:hypothetical protein